MSFQSLSANPFCFTAERSGGFSRAIRRLAAADAYPVVYGLTTVGLVAAAAIVLRGLAAFG